MTHITGPSRHQAALFPESLDELIAQDHPVRVIDAFVDSLDLGRLEFRKISNALSIHSIEGNTAKLAGRSAATYRFTD